jgi:hypothetical protein
MDALESCRDDRTIVMAKLTQEQRDEIRTEWATSPPRQDAEWLSREESGKWDISIEALRRKRLRDAANGNPWSKIVNLGELVRRARLNLDLATGDAVGTSERLTRGFSAEESVEAALRDGAASAKKIRMVQRKLPSTYELG